MVNLLKLIIITSVLLPFHGGATEVISFNEGDIQAVHIRTLASSCAACHGSQGNAVKGGNLEQGTSYDAPSLSGLKAPYFIAQMLAFKAGERAPLIMQRHAKGLSIKEINALGAYFADLKPVLKKPLKPQVLKRQFFNNSHAQ